MREKKKLSAIEGNSKSGKKRKKGAGDGGSGHKEHYNRALRQISADLWRRTGSRGLIESILLGGLGKAKRRKEKREWAAS